MPSRRAYTLLGLASAAVMVAVAHAPGEAGGLHTLAVAGLALVSGSLLAEVLGVAPAALELLLGLVAALAGASPGPLLDGLGLLGSVFIMFMAGVEVDPRYLRRRLASSLASGLASFAVPAVVGYLVLSSLGYSGREALLASIACSTTSVAVVYALVRRAGIARSPLGQLVLSSAMVADVASILAYAAVSGPLGPAAAYLAASVVGAIATARLLAFIAGAPHEAEIRVLLAVLTMMALLGERLGSHAILFAFLLGASSRRVLASTPGLEERISAIVFGLLAPLFFVDAGLHAAPRNPLVYAETALLLLAATLPAKVLATHAALQATAGRRVPVRLSTVFAARLTVSTVIAFSGEAQGILPHDLAGAIIVSALIATLAAAGVARALRVEEL